MISRTLMHNLILVILTTLICSPPVHATEGFSSDLRTAPPAVKKTWDSTFALITFLPKMHTGTAFLFFKRIEDNQIALYFLTADHNVTMCPKGGICPSTALIQNVRLQENPTSVVAETLPGLRFDNVQLDSADLKLANMALLKVLVPMDSQGLPEPVELPKDCDLPKGTVLYGIGWPWTPSRSGRGSLPIIDAGQVVKRWSKGVFVGYFKFTDEEQPMFASSVDSIDGSSGGPIVTENGVVVSLIDKAVTASNYAYVGNDDSRKSTYHTLGPRCAFFKSFRDNLGL